VGRALVALCALNVVFWAVYEQQGNTMQSWADERTVWPVLFGFQVPSTWFQSFNPMMIILLAPLLDGFWRWQQRKGTEPSSVSKMAIGCVLLGLSFIVMILGAQAIGGISCIVLGGVLSFVWFKISNLIIPMRVSRETEIQGADIPEMGALAYPDFELKTTQSVSEVGHMPVKV